jgi:membrane-bound lytic murein transglycosylase D
MLPFPHRDTGANLWMLMGRGAGLPNQVKGSERIDTQRQWLVGNRTFLTRASVRAAPYLYFIVSSLEQRGMPAELALLPMIESAYNPTAVSERKAVGLWQFMPATGKDMGLRQTAAYDARRDIFASTSAALDYLERLHQQFEGDWLLALAAYNSGEGTVSRAIDANRLRGLPTDYWSLHLPRETTDYVPRLLALAELTKDPMAYGVILEPVSDAPYFARVQLPRPVEIKQLALAAGLSERALRLLNPGYLGNTTEEGPGHVLVPVSLEQPVLAMIGASPDELSTRTYPVIQPITVNASPQEEIAQSSR